jgi:tetratricopeptide (TPR) repeat protein
MLKYKILMVMAALLLPSVVSAVAAEGPVLNQGQDFKFLSQQSQEQQDSYPLAVARIKRLVDTGKCWEAEKAFNQLKTDFPEMVRPDSNDFGIFIEAELLRCKGRFGKAALKYRKLLDECPDSEFYEAALDRQFRIATAFLAGEKKSVLGLFRIKGYAEGVKMMERITERTRDEELAKAAAVAVAESFEERNKFEEAFYKWSEVQERWQRDPIAKDALLAKAHCKHALYRGPRFDDSDLIGRPLDPESYHNSAKYCYEQFKSRYPQDAKKYKIDEKIELIE